MARGSWFAAVLGVILLWPACAALAEVVQPTEAITEAPGAENPADDVPAADAETEETPAEADEPPSEAEPAKPHQEKLARIWANEPPLVRLARDKFGEEFTETDAEFFAAVAANAWANFRTSNEKFDTENSDSWKDCPELKGDRIAWMCNDPEASRLVPTQGVWVKGARIVGNIKLYRASVPFSLGFNQCLFGDGVDMRYAKLQELHISDCCSARFQARGAQVTENVYMMRTTVYGGMDFIEAQIGGDLDMNGGFVFHGTSAEDLEKTGVAIDLFDAKIDGDVKLCDNFRAFGKVRLTGARVGRSINCAGGTFTGLGDVAIDTERAQIGQNLSLRGGARCVGCVNIRRAVIGGDLECDGANLSGGQYSALCADLVDVAGQVQLGDGLHAEGEVRFINAVISKDVDCDNGHFINPGGNALTFDSAVIGRSLRLGYDNTGATEQNTDLYPGFVAKGAVRLHGTQVSQDLLAAGAHFELPEGTVFVANNLRVGSRMQISGAEVKGMVDLSAAEVEHELDLRGSHFDGSKAHNRIAIWANGLKVHGHLNSHQVDLPNETCYFRVDGQASFNFAAIDMSWNMYGAQFQNPGGDALDCSDCKVGGYVNLDMVDLNGRVSFSRAKIDGMFILTRTVKPEQTRLDMRFAHVWVIKEEKLDDWPPAGQLQLEGFVYDHFDDDSPLSVDDRLAWLRRQYAPTTALKNSLSPAATAQNIHIKRGDSAIKTRTAELDAALEEGFIMPAGYELESAAAAPSMTAPIVEPQLESPPTEQTGESVAQSESPDGSSFPMMVDPSEIAEPNAEADAPAAAALTQPIAPPDPAGRRYITQPYTQLASVYRSIGQDEQANAVLVARAERLGELATPLSAHGLWYRYIGRLIGYGYEPFRAIKIGAAIVLFGALIFAIGARRNLMAETKLAEHVLSNQGEAGVVSPTYPRFNPLVYSLDVFLPFADLHQRCYWIPGERLTKPRTSRNCLMHIGPYSVKWSGVLRTYLWFQTLAGWTLCTLLAAAVTGIVQS